MTHASKLIRKFKRETGMNYSELARLVGTSKCTISQIVNGKREVSLELLPKMVEVTGIPTDALRPDLAKILKRLGLRAAA